MQKKRFWKSNYEIGVLVEKIGNKPELVRLFSLNQLWKSVIFIDSYAADPSWPKLLEFSEYGNEIIKTLNEVSNTVAPEDFQFALFRMFYHHELLFDWNKSDINGIEDLLQRELTDGLIYLPYRFGRLLYDRFNDNYKDPHPKHLVSDDLLSLISGTPKGIYQIGYYLTGPLGLFQSKEYRYIPPADNLPLWHCPDTGCRSLHKVQILPQNIKLIEAESNIKDILKSVHGPPSNWDFVLTLQYFFNPKILEKKLEYRDLAVLIADCIMGNDLNSLFVAALKTGEGNEFRDILGSPSRENIISSGSPEEIARRATSEEKLQLLFLLKNNLLLQLIDQLIENKQINIPLGQIRSAKIRPPGSESEGCSEISCLGLRSMNEKPLIALFSLIYGAYTENNLLSDLQWGLHSPPGITVKEGLIHFIQENGPAVAIRKLIFITQAITEYVCQKIRVPIDIIEREEENSVNMMLWKIGFSPPQYDDFSKRFLSHIENFKTELLLMPEVMIEDDRERIRSVGVNLFVYVEKFLDMLVSYNIWLLASDHFLGLGMKYNLAEARKTVSKVLGENLTDENLSFKWNESGENSLGVLLRYLSESVTWIMSLETKDREPYKRKDEDLPGNIDMMEIRFPFFHISLFADSELNEIRKYAEDYIAIASLLQKANLAEVRNGLDHMRDPENFPGIDKMLACASRLWEAHHLAVTKRYTPEIFWLEKHEHSSFGVIRFFLRDGENRLFVLFGPPLVQCLIEVGFNKPYVIAPGNLLGAPNSTLAFVVQENTEYDHYWKNYPRREPIQRSDQVVLRNDAVLIENSTCNL